MKKKFILSVVVVILLVIGLGVFMNKSSGPSKYDDFAQNLKAKGAVFYGAFGVRIAWLRRPFLAMLRNIYHTLNVLIQISHQLRPV